MSKKTSIKTPDGDYFDYLDPCPEVIDLFHITTTLGRIPRFAGMYPVGRELTVAHHSLHVARMVPTPLILDALVHDMHEAYIGDKPSPMKEAERFLARMAGFAESPFDVLDRITRRRVRGCFGVSLEVPAVVKAADTTALKIEAAWLWHDEWSPSLDKIAGLTGDEAARELFYIVYDLTERRGIAV